MLFRIFGGHRRISRIGHELPTDHLGHYRWLIMASSVIGTLKNELGLRGRYVTIRHRGELLASRALWAQSVFARGRGLLGTSELIPGRDGCLLDPCRRIHCRGMKYSIDTIHLDENGIVVGLEHVAIGKTGHRFRGSRSILELAEGEVERFGIREGDILSFEPAQIGSPR